ncbi:MAG: sterol desaturase family protein [bacterium]
MIERLIEHSHEILFAGTFGGILLLMLLEPMMPRRKASGDQTTRWINNIGITLLNFYLLAYFGALLGSAVMDFIPAGSSLFDQLGLSLWVTIPATILVFELLSYWLHRAFHRVPLLWRIHAVHHADTEIDVTTTHRHHPFEGMTFMIVALPIMIFLGVPPLAAISYNLLRLTISTISHANIRLPRSLDAVLRLVVITPDFHRLHHSSEQRYTDSNYGVIFPWFDYLFRTATRMEYEDLPKMETGLDYLREPRNSWMDRLLILPFSWKQLTNK